LDYRGYRLVVAAGRHTGDAPLSRRSPVKDRLLRVLVLGVLAALVLGACGGDDDGNSGPATGDAADTQNVPVDDYAADVCTALATWLADFQERASGLLQLEPNERRAEKKQLQEFLGNTADKADDLITAIEAAGVPDTPNGKESAEGILNGFERVSAIFVEAERQIRELRPDKPTAFEQGMQELATRLQEASSQAAASIGSAKSEELTKAFEESEECSRLRSAGP